jgi:hypothetical protein
VFTLVLNLTAGVGPVYLLRWFWWRINPASEMAAMAASIPVLFLRKYIFILLGIPEGPLFVLIYMILGTALFWLPATLLTPPVARETLQNFAAKVNPPGMWKQFIANRENWMPSLKLWILSTAALLLTAIGPLDWMVGTRPRGMLLCALAAVLWGLTVRGMKTPKETVSI